MVPFSGERLDVLIAVGLRALCAPRYKPLPHEMRRAPLTIEPRAQALSVKAGSIHPFSLPVTPEDVLTLLKRLEEARLPEPSPTERAGSDVWGQGVPVNVMQDLIHYWRTDYDWSRLERELGGLGQYTAVVDGVTLHFLHVRSPRPDAKPLLLCHGWPGSIVEFLDVARDLAEPADDQQPAFHLVIPSLPGYGFSSKPTEEGIGVERIADLLAALMSGLGYERYFAQGGDWGGVILTELAVQHPTQLVALHTTLPQASEPQWWNTEEEQKLSPRERQWLMDSRQFAGAASAYAHQQATRPQTIGYALVDSPIGLAAWILDKFESWRDPALAPMSRDRLLDNICLYWFSGSGASAARLYWESYQRSRELRPVLVPTAVSVYPKDIEKLPASWVRERYRDLYRWETREAGGHFPTLEVKDDYVDMVRAAFITF